ncbi:MAG: hypothetical protein HYT03_02680 [Candidatus Harrisonbacteria bacterium]|nr:hypothetical protein [Candidatus Harrisonbacteria bacterium]
MAKSVSRLRKGQIVWIAVHGAGVTSYEEYVVDSVSNGRVRVPDLSGPFDAKTGKYLGETFPGFSLELLLEKPKGFKKH